MSKIPRPERAHSTTMNSMQKPRYGKQRSASGAFSLSRALPKLRLPPSGVSRLVQRPQPRIGKPTKRGEE